MKVDEKFLNYTLQYASSTKAFLRTISDFKKKTLYFDINTNGKISSFKYKYHIKYIDDGKIEYYDFRWWICNFKVISCNPFVFMADGITFFAYEEEKQNNED